MANIVSYQRTIRIQKDRIGAIIGKNGSTKQEIQRRFNVEIEIDSDQGDITMKSRLEDVNVLDLNRAMEIITAISKGFSPERAFNLFNEDNVFEVIDLRDSAGRSENRLSRIKSRLIGEKGKSRKTIEDLSGAYISIYGHTVSFIGSSEQIRLASEAIDMICSGRSHKLVYNFLQETRRKAKIERMKLWE